MKRVKLQEGPIRQALAVLPVEIYRRVLDYLWGDPRSDYDRVMTTLKRHIVMAEIECRVWIYVYDAYFFFSEEEIADDELEEYIREEDHWEIWDASPEEYDNIADFVSDFFYYGLRRKDPKSLKIRHKLLKLIC